MSRLVLLVGTSHHIQFGLDEPEEFYNFLLEACREHEIQAVAEEANPDQLRYYQATQTVPGRVADFLGLRHLYCDPDKRTRAELGIIDSNELLAKKFIDAPPGDDGPFMLDAADCAELNRTVGASSRSSSRPLS
jgi:hypothetical protein